MKRFIIKIILFSVITFGIIVSVNYMVDPANMFHYSILDSMVDHLMKGEIIECPGNLDEGLLQEKMITSMEHKPSTVIIGSSHIMYEKWEFENYYCAGLSGAYLGDYYAIVGLLETADIHPERIVIGVDPWSFMTGATNGRHSSITEYSRYAKELVQGNEHTESPMANGWTVRKIQELFSFSYFQSSLADLRMNGIERCLHRNETESIVICHDDEIGEVSKILPNGRRVFAKAGIGDVKTNTENAQKAIEARGIYQLGSGFREPQYENLAEFEELIQYLQKQGIEVIFYLHSWYPCVYDFFETDEDYLGIIELEQYIRNMADKNQIIVHGSYNPYEVGVTEKDFADWFHLKPESMMDCYVYIR